MYVQPGALRASDPVACYAIYYRTPSEWREMRYDQCFAISEDEARELYARQYPARIVVRIVKIDD